MNVYSLEDLSPGLAPGSFQWHLPSTWRRSLQPVIADLLCPYFNLEWPAVSSLVLSSAISLPLMAIGAGCLRSGFSPPLLQLFAIFFLPETPSWLFRYGLEKHALETLRKLRKDTHWLTQVEAMKSAASSQRSGPWKSLLSPKLRSILIIGQILSACQQITGINTVIYYAPKIFEIAGFASSDAAIRATLSIGLIIVLVTAISVWLLDKMGRRQLLLICAAGMAASLASLSYAFFSNSSFIGVISTVSLIAYVAFFAIGLGPVTWVVLSEIYPLKVRAKAMTIAIFINWLSNYFVSLTFLSLIKELGSSGTFLLYAAISCLAFWSVYRFIPETRGKSLEEIEKMVSR